jgi:hypothetical protein
MKKIFEVIKANRKEILKLALIAGATYAGLAIIATVVKSRMNEGEGEIPEVEPEVIDDGIGEPADDKE